MRSNIRKIWIKIIMHSRITQYRRHREECDPVVSSNIP